MGLRGEVDWEEMLVDEVKEEEGGEGEEEKKGGELKKVFERVSGEVNKVGVKK